MIRLRGAIALPVAALLAVAPAFAAHAEGSVPSEVATYVADGSLVRQLDDVYGVGASGDGIDFDPATTKTGTIERVAQWSAALLAGEDTDHPVDLLNEWIVPITIADAPVGVATVWINPASVAPDLASFTAGEELATALSAVPDGATLVRDDASTAWLALADDGTVTPLVPGSTGLSTPVPLDDIAIIPPSAAAGEPGDATAGVGLAVTVVLVLFAIIVVALVIPVVRGRRLAAGEADAGDLVSSADTRPIPVVVIPDAAGVAVPGPRPRAAPTAKPAPRSGKPAPAARPGAKPAVRPGSKPAPRGGPRPRPEHGRD